MSLKKLSELSEEGLVCDLGLGIRRGGGGAYLEGGQHPLQPGAWHVCCFGGTLELFRCSVQANGRS